MWLDKGSAKVGSYYYFYCFRTALIELEIIMQYIPEIYMETAEFLTVSMIQSTKLN